MARKNPRVPVDIVARTGKFNSSIKKSAKAATASFTAFAAASTAAVVGITKATINLSGELNQLAKDAKRIGVSVEEYQKLNGAIGLLTDGTVKVTDALQEYQKKTGEASPDLVALAEKFAGLDDAAERTALGMELFGARAGKQMAGALAEGGPAVQKAIDDIEQAGLVSSEAAANAEVLQDQIALASQEFGMLRTSALAPLIPVVAEAVVTIRLLKEELGLTSDAANEAGTLIGGFASRMIGGFAVRTFEGRQELSRYAENFRALARTAKIGGEILRDVAANDFASAERGLVALRLAGEGAYEELSDGAKDLVRDRKAVQQFKDEMLAAHEALKTDGSATGGGGGAPPPDGPTGGGGSGEFDEALSAEEAYFAARAAEQAEYNEAAATLLGEYQTKEEEVAASVAATWESVGQKRAQAASQALGAVSQTLGAIASLHTMVTDGQIAELEAKSDAHEAALKEQWEAQTAIAITQAALNVGLAISNAFANAPNPIVGGVMAAISGTVAAINLAAVIAKAAQGPSFHMGGMVGGGPARSISPAGSPDEVNATLLRGERVQSRAEVRAGRGPQTVTTVFQVGPRTVDAMTTEALRTGQGSTFDAFRAVQPRRVGRHNPRRRR